MCEGWGGGGGGDKDFVVSLIKSGQINMKQKSTVSVLKQYQTHTHKKVENASFRQQREKTRANDDRNKI